MRSFALFTYIQTATEEARKVVWPSRETVLRHTVMVVVSVAVGVLVFAGIDYGLQQLTILAIN